MAKKVRSAYIGWIKTLRCGRCPDQVTPTEAHHFNADLHQSGMAMRAADHLAVPLCRCCHRLFHGAHWGTNEERLFEQRGILIKTLIQAFDAGMIELTGDGLPEW